MAAVSGSGFDAAGFRAGIKRAMKMGKAPSADEQVVFHFAETVTAATAADSSGVPFDPAAPATRAEASSAVAGVDYALEYLDANNLVTATSSTPPAKLCLTLLDVDYAKVKDAAYVTCSGERYDYERSYATAGLFEVAIYETIWKRR